MERFKKLITIGSLIMVAFLLSGVWAQAQGIKERMKARLPIINQLKEKGVVGESNQGYLAFVGSAKERADIVNAENDDRKKVYQAIAKKQGVPIAVVGKRRAVQIAAKERAGSWLQDSNGKWYRKK